MVIFFFKIRILPVSPGLVTTLKLPHHAYINTAVQPSLLSQALMATDEAVYLSRL